MDAVEEGLVDADEIGQALGRSVNMPGLDADEILIHHACLWSKVLRQEVSSDESN